MRFGNSQQSLVELFVASPLADIKEGIHIGRFSIEPARAEIAAAMLAGAVMSSMLLVVDGQRTLREAGETVAAMILRAFGVPPEEADQLAQEPLP